MCGPARVELVAQGKFVLQLAEDGTRRMLLDRHHHQDRRRPFFRPAARKPHASILPELFDNVKGRTNQRGKLHFHA